MLSDNVERLCKHGNLGQSQAKPKDCNNHATCHGDWSSHLFAGAPPPVSRIGECLTDEGHDCSQSTSRWLYGRCSSRWTTHTWIWRGQWCRTSLLSYTRLPTVPSLSALTRGASPLRYDGVWTLRHTSTNVPRPSKKSFSNNNIIKPLSPNKKQTYKKQKSNTKTYLLTKKNSNNP